MNAKNVFIFIGGAVLGGICGYFAASKVLDKKYFDKYDEKAKELEEYYDRTNRYDREIDKDFDEHEDLVKEKEGEDREKGSLSKEKREEIKKKLLKNEKMTTNYASMYKENKEKEVKNDIDLAEMEHPEEDEEDEEEENDDPEMERAFDKHLKDRNREPRIISAEAAGELGPEWDEQTLFYYFYEEILVTEDDDVIEDESLLIGDCLDKYGFSDSTDEMTIYVQNFAHQCVYEVRKVMGHFGD